MQYEHMNALKCPDIEKFFGDKNYIAEEKFDGVRLFYEGGKLFTRNGKEKATKLPSIIQRLEGIPAILDGELYIPGKTSKDITKFISSKKLVESNELCFVVFDVLEYKNISLAPSAWIDRRTILERLAAEYHLSISAFSEDKESLLGRVQLRGGEGVMLKNIRSCYIPGSRPANTWYKVKKHDTTDVIITGFTPGTGKNEGLIGSINFQNGRCSGMTDEFRTWATSHQNELIGRTMEIGYMERTEAGCYRHPVFIQIREDK